MKKLLTVIVIILGLNLSAQNYIEHKIKEGETIESIAKKYLVTPYDIYALNPDAKAKFQTNTVLIIPNSKIKNEPIDEESKELIGYKTHKVKRKETLYGLSKKYGVSEDEIKKANRFLYSENLKKGDKIRIPKYKTFVSKVSLKNTVKKYKVQPKEGKWRIAYKFGITIEELEALNSNMKPILQPGDELNVPNIEDKDEKIIEAEYDYYEVLPKEGFYRLKIKTGLTQEELEALNPELKESGLKVGMVLKIPATAQTTSGLMDLETTKLESKIKNYKVKKLALMLPYRLHRIDVDSIEEVKEEIKTNRLLSTVLDFHVGVRMALDSAKQLGISTNLKVFDTEYQPSTVSKILSDNDFSDYDAVIGPIQDQSFDRVANSLKSDRVPVIAALNNPKEIYANVFRTIPEDKLLQTAIVEFVKRDSLKTKVMIIADEASNVNVSILKNEISGITVKYARKHKKTGLPFFYPTDLENTFAEGKTYVFLETKSNAFASSVISLLNGINNDKIKIILTTLDKGKQFDGKDISNNHLSNLQFHYPSVHKDFDEYKSNGFVKTYKKEFGVSPSKYAARGFDVTLDILLRLSTEDNLYEASSEEIETEYIENKFRYTKSLFGGYTNEAVYIVKYDDLRIVKAN